MPLGKVDAGAVDQPVNAPVPVENPAGDALDVGASRDVKRFDLDAGLRRERREPRLVAIGDDDARALAGEDQRGRPADAGRSTRDPERERFDAQSSGALAGRIIAAETPMERRRGQGRPWPVTAAVAGGGGYRSMAASVTASIPASLAASSALRS